MMMHSHNIIDLKISISSRVYQDPFPCTNAPQLSNEAFQLPKIENIALVLPYYETRPFVSVSHSL